AGRTAGRPLHTLAATRRRRAAGPRRADGLSTARQVGCACLPPHPASAVSRRGADHTATGQSLLGLPAARRDAVYVAHARGTAPRRRGAAWSLRRAVAAADVLAGSARGEARRRLAGARDPAGFADAVAAFLLAIRRPGAGGLHAGRTHDAARLGGREGAPHTLAAGGRALHRLHDGHQVYSRELHPRRGGSDSLAGAPRWCLACPARPAD